MAAPYVLKFTGISGYSPLSVPILNLDTDFRARYITPIAPKVGNSDEDITVNLNTWALVKDLSAGAFRKFLNPGENHYYLPSPSGTGDTWTDDTVFPLGWTLRANEPLMCGCGHKAQNGDWAFKKMVEFDGGIYAIDEKNNKVFKDVAGTWTDQTAGLNGTYPTDIFASSSILYVGTNSGAARYYNGAAWNTFVSSHPAGADARCFTLAGTQDVGYVLWHSGTGATKHIVYENRAGGRFARMGNDLYPIESLEWFGTGAPGIFATKRDGAYFFNPGTRVVSRVHDSQTRSRLNGRALCFFDNRVFYGMDGQLWSWTGAGAPRRESFAQFEGTGGDPFYSGDVIGLISDGPNLYALLKVTTSDSTVRYQYWLCICTGPGEWHPVLLINGTVAAGTGLPSGAYEPGALLFDSNKLRYSAGNDVSNNGRAKTGYLHTDGIDPRSSGGASPSEPYTKNVAIHLGWFDGGKRALAKVLKELRYTLYDRGTTGKVKFYYRKWTDSSWTLIGESTTGTQDNTTLAIPTDNQLGITVNNYFAIKVELTNTSATPAEAWWLSDLNVIGAAGYPGVYVGGVEAWLPENSLEQNELTPEGFNADTIEAGLRVAITQTSPIKMEQLWNGRTHYVRLSDGEEYIDSSRKESEGADDTAVTSAEWVAHRRFRFQFREVA